MGTVGDKAVEQDNGGQCTFDEKITEIILNLLKYMHLLI